MRRLCTLFGVTFHGGDWEDIEQWWLKAAKKPGTKVVVTPNPEIILRSFKDTAYQKTLAEADLSLPDGTGLLWASTFLKESEGKGKLQTLWVWMRSYLALLVAKKSLTTVIPAVITGSGTMERIHGLIEKEGQRVYYFGASTEENEAMRKRLLKKYPELQVAGYSSCRIGSKEEEAMLKEIEKTKPTVLFAALSFPAQETWLIEHRDRLSNAGVRIAMGVGGSFAFLGGTKKRAPGWMQRFGLEWLWRLCLEPSRWKRIGSAVCVFPWNVLQRKLQGIKDLSIS